MALKYKNPATVGGRVTRQRAIKANVKMLPDGDTMVSRILEVYDRAPQDVKDDGALWYKAGHVLGRSLANDPTVGAGVIAALSPQKGWNANVQLAAKLLTGGRKVGHFRDAVDKARRIKRGADPRVVLGGQKVRSFYLNLSMPDHPGPVTNDRHAFAIVMGRECTDAERKLLDRPGVYEMIAAAYRKAARLRGVIGNVMQAVTWVQWRTERGIVD